MLIQVQTNNHMEGKQETTDYITAKLESELSRFSERIARVEVFLSDENGDKAGETDKRCTMEARLEGVKPVTVSNFAPNIHYAIEGATDKLIKALDHTIGKLRDKNRSAEEATMEEL
jgi:ribosome-associated translation inhibitor RaiA